MKKLKLSRGIIPLVLAAAVLGVSRFFPGQVGATLTKVLPRDQNTEWYQLVEGSIYDGDTLRVERGGQELKIRMCGVDSPELEQPGGVEAREHLRSLVAQGDGAIGVVPIEKDRYRRTVADLFVPIGEEEEIHLNSQMVIDGMAYHYEKYSGSCPQSHILAKAEEIAKEQSVGVWVNPNAEKPWDYRKRN